MMIKSFFSTTVIAAASLLCFCGCQDTVNTAENSEKSMVQQNVDYKYFSTDSFCRDRLKVLNINKSITPGGMMKVQFTMRSERYGFWSEIWSYIMDDNPYYISYKVDWLDADGMKVRTAGDSWLTEIFIPGETKYLTSVAPNSKCKDFFVSFKEAAAR